MVARAYSSDVDDLAARLGDMLRRTSALERMVGRGGGGGSNDPATQFWNSAWGVLSHTPSPASVVTVAATSTLLATSPPVQLYAGRRYRVRAGVRAWLSASATDMTLVVTGPFAPGSNAHDQYAVVASSYSQAEWSAVFDCTADTPGATYAFTITTIAAATVYGGGNAGLTVEDVGPTTMVPTAPPPADWAPFDARYIDPVELAAALGLYLPLTGGALSGDLTIDPGALFFGSRTVQQLNLYATSYGLGVQSSTLYFRSSNVATFSWHRGGVHSNVANDPGAGGVEAMRIDATGRLLTNGATDLVHLVSNVGAHCYIGFFNGDGVNGATIATRGTRRAYAGIVSSHFYVNNEIAGGHIYLNAGPTGGQIIFQPQAAEQARFDASGIFLVAKAATSATVLGTEILQTGTVQATRADAGAPYACNKQVGATSGSPMFAWRVDNTQIGSVSRNAATAAVLYNTTSQINLKGRIKRLDGQAALDLVKSWEPIRFQFRYDKKGRLSDKGTPQRDELAGFDAEKMHALVPYAVAPGHGTLAEHYEWQARKQAEYDAEMAYQAANAEYERRTQANPLLTLDRPVPPPSPDPYDEDPFTPWGMDHSMLVPDLTAAVQRLAAMVEAQATELTELRALVSAK